MRVLTTHMIIVATLAVQTSLAHAGDCPADLDGTNIVDGGDLAVLLGAWGSCDDPDTCTADLDASGDVDGADLAILLGAWGACPDPFKACGQPDAGDCCDSNGNGTPGCGDDACCESVCVQDPYCCDVIWDSECANLAVTFCECESTGLCGKQATGDCCKPNGSPGCNHAPCCDAVCSVDPYCCAFEWDQFCVQQAFDLCTVCQ